ncbi:MAG: hypothetical protein AAF940_13910, partial [Pseudomonadota bacterium]
QTPQGVCRAWHRAAMRGNYAEAIRAVTEHASRWHAVSCAGEGRDALLEALRDVRGLDCRVDDPKLDRALAAFDSAGVLRLIAARRTSHVEVTLAGTFECRGVYALDGDGYRSGGYDIVLRNHA